MLVAGSSCLVAVGLVYHYLIASPRKGAMTAARPPGSATGLSCVRVRTGADEASLLAEEGACGALELPVRAELAAPRDQDVWRAKADEPPVWVVPAGSQI